MTPWVDDWSATTPLDRQTLDGFGVTLEEENTWHYTDHEGLLQSY